MADSRSEHGTDSSASTMLSNRIIVTAIVPSALGNDVDKIDAFIPDSFIPAEREIEPFHSSSASAPRTLRASRIDKTNMDSVLNAEASTDAQRHDLCMCRGSAMDL